MSRGQHTEDVDADAATEMSYETGYFEFFFLVDRHTDIHPKHPFVGYLMKE